MIQFKVGVFTDVQPIKVENRGLGEKAQLVKCLSHEDKDFSLVLIIHI